MVIRKSFQIVKVLVWLFMLSIIFGGSTYAANGTISVVPSSGNYYTGETFDAQVRIDGGGTPFNAAEANVSVSENLKIERLTLGDCGFAFVDTPTVASPSFVGVNLGGSRNSCTIYTLTLRVIGQNSGYVFVSDASLKSYEGAQELLSRVNNSSYTFGGSQSVIQEIEAPPPTQPPLSTASGESVYTLVYTISAEDSKASNYKVVLDPEQPNSATSDVQPLIEDSTILAAVFENVSEGVHSIEVRDNDKVVSSEIVNIEGPNREINLGVTPKKTGLSFGSIMLLAFGAIVIITFAILGYIFYWKKKHPSS